MTVAQDGEGAPSRRRGEDGPARRRGEGGPARRCGDGAPSRRLLDADWFNKLLIVSCALAWGFSFFLMKDVTAEFPVFWLLFVRFGIASLLMLAVFWCRIRAHVTGPVIRTGIVLGVFYGLGYVFQTFGIVFTTPGKNAFLTGIYCVLVPFCAWAMGKGAPRRTSVIAALASLAGMGLVVLDNGLPLNAGDLLTLVGAVFFALEMVVVASEGRDKDVWALTFWQFVTITAIVGAGTLALERPPEPELFTPDNVGSLVFLAVICSFAALAVLNYAFTKVDPSAGSLLSSLESPSGVAFSVAFGYEGLTPRLLFGFALIFCGIVFSEAGDKIVVALPKRRRR